jgi:hypothetical protein
MSNYLKDGFIPYHTIGLLELDGINDDLKEIVEKAALSANDDNPLQLVYTLRYDWMGIVRQDYNEVKHAFERAKNIERLLFEVKGPQWAKNQTGKYILLKLDLKDFNGCYLRVDDDDEKWVDHVYKRLTQRLEQYKNNNGKVRAPEVDLILQLFGVIAMFFGSLILASICSPSLKLKDSFLVVYIGSLLVFSNLWTYVLISIKKLRDDFWPIVSFKRKPLGLFGQTVVAFAITAILAWLVDLGWKILLDTSSLVVK